MKTVLLSIAVFIFFTGCSYKAKFEQKQVVNFAPFTEQTMTLLGDTNYDLDDDYKLFLREIDSLYDDPQLQEMYTLQKDLMATMRGIMIYSLQLGSISNMDANGTAKANLLADMIIRLKKEKSQKESLKDIDVSNKQFDEIIASMRRSETLLIAMQSSQVIINEIIRISMNKLDRLRELEDIAAAKIDKKINEKFEESLNFDKEVHKRRQIYMKALRLLALYEEGNEELSSLQALNIYMLKGTLKNKKSLTIKEMDTLYKIISKNLNDLRMLKNDIKPDIQEYHAYLKEFQNLTLHNNSSIKHTRRSIILWARAHSAMSSGKWNPSEWFGFSDAGSLLMEAARKAAPL